MLANKCLSGLLESRHVDTPRESVDIACEEWRTYLLAPRLSEENAIFVGLCDDRVTRMKGFRDNRRFEDAYGSRQDAVQRAQQVRGGDGRPKGKTRHLRQGVNAGVGATGALRQGGLAGNATQSRLQLTLHGAVAPLHLP